MICIWSNNFYRIKIKNGETHFLFPKLKSIVGLFPDKLWRKVTLFSWIVRGLNLFILLQTFYQMVTLWLGHVRLVIIWLIIILTNFKKTWFLWMLFLELSFSINKSKINNLLFSLMKNIVSLFLKIGLNNILTTGKPSTNKKWCISPFFILFTYFILLNHSYIS